MIRIRRLHASHLVTRVLVVLTGLAAALLANGAAFASPVPPPGRTGPGHAPAQVHTIVVGGMPGWQIALIAAAAAFAAAAAAVFVDRARAARRHQPAPSA